KWHDDSANLVDRSCVARADGRWDYYPNGFKSTGCVVDDNMRQRLVDARGNLAGPATVVTVAAVGFGFGLRGRRLMSEIDPAFSPFADSGIIRWSIVALLGLILMLSLFWIQQRRVRRILVTADPATKGVHG